MSLLNPIKLNPETSSYFTKDNIMISRNLQPLEVELATTTILQYIDQSRGALFTSGYEYPGRYSRWDIGFIHPPLEIRASSNQFVITPLNERGELLMKTIEKKLAGQEWVKLEHTATRLSGEVVKTDRLFSEEERTQQPTVFTLIRAIKDMFFSQEDSYLGLYGAFGYDLVFQFEPMELTHKRQDDQSDLVLFLPDELVIVDHQMSCAYQLSYEFEIDGRSTDELPRTNAPRTNSDAIDQTDLNNPFSTAGAAARDYLPGKYANLVREASKKFVTGDLFEVVPSHTRYEACQDKPSDIFKRLRELNPSPYGFIINLGSEYLVGSSPEMYVRVEGDRVETCPISGTVKRGSNAIEDAEQIRTLLNSRKDEAELTMCTDVDRNDKSRICVPGSVKVIGRRQLEMYSHLIHTVDHVEGKLSPQYDSLDAFMTHMWAVTITGAPKRAAIKWIEEHEADSRNWYGGAVGYLAFNGDLNTGLTLRTIHIKNNIAAVRAGATLLIDSIPEDEEEETLTKGAALIAAIRGERRTPAAKAESAEKLITGSGKGKKVLVVDHEDSFVHTLSNYIRQTGAEVVTLRTEAAQRTLRSDMKFDLVILSPGPGSPADFRLSRTIELCLQRNLPIFGVCLGLQGIVEHFGGQLDMLGHPQHGKPAKITTDERSFLWDSLPASFTVGRYHSLHAAAVPDCLTITATAEDQTVMAIEHKELPIAAVQFHPESILTLQHNSGMRIINNIMKQLSVVNR